MILEIIIIKIKAALNMIQFLDNAKKINRMDFFWKFFNLESN